MGRQIRLAFLGDSLFEGYALAPDEALPVVMQRQLRIDGYEVEALNFGVSGETAREGLLRLDHVIAADPHAVLLEFGANDFYMQEPPADVEGNLASILEILTKRNIPVLLVGIRALLGVVDRAYKDAFDPMYERLSKRFGVPLYPDILAPYYGNHLLSLMDGIHPNEQGVEAMACDMLPSVKALLEKL